MFVLYERSRWLHTSQTAKCHCANLVNPNISVYHIYSIKSFMLLNFNTTSATTSSIVVCNPIQMKPTCLLNKFQYSSACTILSHWRPSHINIIIVRWSENVVFFTSTSSVTQKQHARISETDERNDYYYIEENAAYSPACSMQYLCWYIHKSAIHSL